MRIEIILTEALLSEDKIDYVVLDLETQNKIKKNFFSINFALTSLMKDGKEFVPHFINTIKDQVLRIQSNKPNLKNVFVLIPLNSFQLKYFKNESNLDNFIKRIGDEMDIYDKKHKNPIVCGYISDPIKNTPPDKLSSLIFLKIESEQVYSSVFPSKNFFQFNECPDLIPYFFLVEK